MAEVKVAHFTVVISGLSEEIHNTKDSAENGKWRMRIREIVISYEWDRIVGYWRVVQSAVTGTTIGKVPSPGHWTWPRGDAGKPEWVVLLEFENYPQRTMTRQKTVL